MSMSIVWYAFGKYVEDVKSMKYRGVGRLVSRCHRYIKSQTTWVCMYTRAVQYYMYPIQRR